MGEQLLLIGAGGDAAVVSETIHDLKDNANNPVYDCIDYLDDNSEKAIEKIKALDVIGKNYEEVFCCIGNNKLRGELIVKAKKCVFNVPVIIHPSAYVSSSAIIKEGTSLEPKPIVNANSVVSEGCIISVGSIVNHDVKVEKFCHVNEGSICKAGSIISNERKLEAGEVVKGY